MRIQLKPSRIEAKRNYVAGPHHAIFNHFFLQNTEFANTLVHDSRMIGRKMLVTEIFHLNFTDMVQFARLSSTRYTIQRLYKQS